MLGNVARSRLFCHDSVNDMQSATNSFQKARGLRPAHELAAGRPHGDRLRYIGGCRCQECRAANTAYERQRAVARKAGDWNGIVPATRAREHMAKLSAAGVGRRQVSDASGVADSILFSVVNGTRANLRALTERAILAVTVAAAADHALIDAKPTWKLLDALVAWGYPKSHLARELGRQTPALQIGRKQCTVRNAFEVQRLYERLKCVPSKRFEKQWEELREEGFRPDRIERMLAELAERQSKPAPVLTVQCGVVRADAADLLAQLHADLVGEPA